jgi:hypothetical protein
MRYHEDPRYPLGESGGKSTPRQSEYLIVDEDLVEQRSATIRNIFSSPIGRKWENGEAYDKFIGKHRNRFLLHPIIYVGHLAQSPIFGHNEGPDRWDCLKMGEFNLWRAFTIWVRWIVHKDFTARVTAEIKNQLHELSKFLMLYNEEDNFEKAILEAYNNKRKYSTTSAILKLRMTQ